MRCGATLLATSNRLGGSQFPSSGLHRDNGSEFTAGKVRKGLQRVEVTTLFIVLVSPREKGSIESFISKLRDEILNGEILETTSEA